MELSEYPGPPRVKNYQGHSRLKASKKTVTVTLDAGAFWAVWETVEAKAKNPSAAHDAYRRALPAFREAFYLDHPEELPPAPAVKAGKKVIPRRVS